LLRAGSATKQRLRLWQPCPAGTSQASAPAHGPVRMERGLGRELGLVQKARYRLSPGDRGEELLFGADHLHAGKGGVQQPPEALEKARRLEHRAERDRGKIQ